MCSSDWDGGQCVDVTGACATNADCKDADGNVDKTKYCKISARYAGSSVTSCFKNYSGTCTAIGSKSEATESNDEVTIEGWTVYRSSSSDMNWWSAKNWCEAQGKRLISADHLGCYKDDGTTPFGDKTAGFCCAEGQANCGSTLSKQSAIMQALRREWSGAGAWTNTSYDSCDAFIVRLYTGFVGINFRNNYGGNYALCEK